MKAAVLFGQQDLRYTDFDTPKINEREILIKVKATGICGSDLPRVLGTGAHFYPIVLGHEFAGEVVEIGPETQNVKVGEHVTGAPLVPCHRCIDCYQGAYAQCKNYTFIGSRIPGSWAEYVKIPAINAVKLPEGVTYEQGALFEPATVALHGLSVMNFQGGYDVAIVGVGTIGLLALQCAKLLGAGRIFAFDIDENKLKLAGEYGADYLFNTGDPDFRGKIQSETGGRGFAMVVETGGVEFTEKLSLEIAGNKGNVMFIGTPSKNITLAPREFEYINRKELTVRGSWMSYSAPFPGREWELAGYYFKQGKIRYLELIDRMIPLSEIGAAFKDLAVPGRVSGKILLKG
ncbi:MAG TPA: galactitol-1-phosphate 5-dehydrogenase [Bacillota bacterium]|nr:galactitol-1-phosphate 5-dehydrogenase [Bacillota bacterium]